MEDKMMQTVYYDQDEKEQGRAGLIIFDRRKETQVILLEGKQVTIGRDYPGEKSDIRFESEIVSRDHGIVVKENGGWWYQDRKSTNGTFCDGTLLFNTDKKVRLKNGDVLRVDSMNPSKRHKDSVLIIFSERCRKNDKWESCCLEKGSTIIGRDEERCKIVLSDPHVSKSHAEIRSDKDGKYWIRDLDSYNGTFVNGTEVKKWRRLQDKDVIMICGVRLIFADNTILYSHEKIAGVQMEVDIKKKEVPSFDNKGKMVTLLKDIHLDLESGDFVTILGGSGAGKSTLLGCMNGFEQEGVHGQIRVNGINLYQNYDKLKMIIGYVPQSDDDLPQELTAYELVYTTAQLRVSWETPKELKQRVERTLQSLNLTAKKRTLVHKLSGGEKRRVSIAMELVADPMIIFMDEATSGLDPKSEKEVMEISKRIAHDQNKIVMMITHNTQNIVLCDKLIVLCKAKQVGRLAFFGTPEETLRYFDISSINEVYDKLNTQPEKYVRH